MGKAFTNHKGIKSLKPPERGHVMHKDTQCKGLYLRSYASGTMVFIHRYWIKGRERLVRLEGLELNTKSTERAISSALHTARAKVSEQKEQARQGNDPALERDLKARQIAAMPTIADFADTYIKMYAKPRKKSWKEDKRLLDVDVIPLLGVSPMDKVTRSHLIALLDRKQQAGAEVTRNRLLSLLSKFFNFAIERGVLENNPASKIKRTKEKSRGRVLTEDEMRFLWEQTAGKGDHPSVTCLALRMILVTGQRPSEICKMHESQLQDDVWRMEDTKNGRKHEVPLSPMALEVISQARLFSRNGLLFPNTKDAATHHSTLSQYMKRIDWPKERATPHDLRRTAITGISKLGFNRLVQDKIANHVDNSIGGVYDRHDYMKEKRQALEAWARELERVISGTSQTNNVVEFKTG